MKKMSTKSHNGYKMEITARINTQGKGLENALMGKQTESGTSTAGPDGSNKE